MEFWAIRREGWEVTAVRIQLLDSKVRHNVCTGKVNGNAAGRPILGFLGNRQPLGTAQIPESRNI